MILCCNVYILFYKVNFIESKEVVEEKAWYMCVGNMFFY